MKFYTLFFHSALWHNRFSGAPMRFVLQVVNNALMRRFSVDNADGYNLSDDASFLLAAHNFGAYGELWRHFLPAHFGAAKTGIPVAC